MLKINILIWLIVALNLGYRLNELHGGCIFCWFPFISSLNRRTAEKLHIYLAVYRIFLQSFVLRKTVEFEVPVSEVSAHILFRVLV